MDMGNQSTTSSNQDVTVKAQESFKLKRYFSALSGKDTLKIARAMSGSLVLPGYVQAYNRDYWKIPVVVAGMGSGLYMGYRYNMKYLDTEDAKMATYRNLCYIGAGLFYWGGLLDGVINYKSDDNVLPARATLYSALLPGLGQIYNRDYWKLPIVYGGLIACGYFYNYNQLQYQRFRTLFNQASATPPLYEGWMTADNLKWYRDTFRRYRDYSIIAILVMYGLNVIDANVFAHFQNFDISDDLTLRLEPNLIQSVYTPMQVATTQAVGVQMRLTF